MALTTRPERNLNHYLRYIREAHVRCARSLREVGEICDLDHSYVSLILEGKRFPTRDVLITLCLLGWYLDLPQTDEILILMGYLPLGRSTRREIVAVSKSPASPAPSAQHQTSREPTTGGRS